MPPNVPRMPRQCRTERMVIGEFWALLMIVRLPAKFPVVKGVKVARTTVELPGAHNKP